jgi:16S rRNA C967 or C1407 C5-methylase (RsmB/RsmF family)
MSPFENEELISKFLKKRENVTVVKSVVSAKELALKDLEKIKIYEQLQCKVEQLEHGFIFLPDVSDCGPMYFCILEK